MTTDNRWRILLVSLLALTILATVLMVSRGADFSAAVLTGAWAVVAWTLAIRVLAREKSQLPKGRFMDLALLVVGISALGLFMIMGWFIGDLFRYRFESLELLAPLTAFGAILLSPGVGCWLLLQEGKRGRILLGCVYLALSLLCHFLSLIVIASLIPAFDALYRRSESFGMLSLFVPYAIWLFAEITYLLPRRTPAIKQKPEPV